MTTSSPTHKLTPSGDLLSSITAWEVILLAFGLLLTLMMLIALVIVFVRASREESGD